MVKCIVELTEEDMAKGSESLAMWPAASVSGYYFAHPDAQYFGVGKITQDQVVSFSKRKNIDLKEAEKWLRPNIK